jgi:peptidoglycan/LPS O-acetylase OafA/YrhL
LGFAALVASVVVRGDHGLRRFLDNRLVRHIGVVSYGIYLLHVLVANVGKKGLHLQSTWALLAWTVPASIAVASVVYRLYEAPFLRLKKRFASSIA